MNISLNRERALSVVDKAFDFLGNTYVGFIIIAISLFYNNYYFDMLQAKWYVFVYGTLIYICLLGGGIFFIYSVIKGKINYKNYSLICLYNGIILIVINVLKEINWFEDMGKLQCFIGSYFVGGVFIVFSMICLLRNKQLIKISVIFLVIIAVLGGKYCKEYFIFDSSWGNNRGYIWGYAVEILKKGDLFDVLFGRGCDTFGVYANQYFKDEISLIWNKRLINAHNEFLQLLVTCGCVGVSSYYFAWFGYIRRGLKQNKMLSVIISISLLTYLIQQLVNNIQTITTPLSFVFLGVLNSLVMKEISQD